MVYSQTVRRTVHPYSFFLSDAFRTIFHLRLNGDGMRYYMAVKGLVNFLPTQIKVKIEDRVNEFEGELNKIRMSRDLDLFKSQSRRNVILNDKCYEYGDKLLDLIIRELDKMHMLVSYRFIYEGFDEEET